MAQSKAERAEKKRVRERERYHAKRAQKQLEAANKPETDLRTHPPVPAAAPKDRELMTRSEYGKDRGMPYQTIYQVGRRGEFPMWGAYLDVLEADAYFMVGTAAPPPKESLESAVAAAPPAAGVVSIPDIRESQAKHEFYKAASTQVNYLKDAHLLCLASEVKAENSRIYRSLRDLIMGLPTRLCDQMAAETDAGKIRYLLEDELRLALSTAVEGISDGTVSEVIPVVESA